MSGRVWVQRGQRLLSFTEAKTLLALQKERRRHGWPETSASLMTQQQQQPTKRRRKRQRLCSGSSKGPSQYRAPLQNSKTCRT